MTTVVDQPAPFEHVIRITWGHCDPAQIVYTGHIPWFALDAINGWWEHHTGDGWFQMELDRNLGTPFVSMKLDFQSPITPRHRLICRVWPNRMGETSIGFHVQGLQDGEVCFEGDFVSVFTQADTFKKTRAPEQLRSIIKQHLIQT